MTTRRTMNLLFVCTANVCRSPLAAGLMAHHARLAGANVRVSSASIDEQIRAMHPTTLQLLADRGVRLDRTKSQPLTAELVDGADLVLAMTIDHANTVVGRYPSSRAKVYVLGNLAALIPDVGPQDGVDEWLSAVESVRGSLVMDDGWNITDPNGMPPHVYREVDATLDRATSWLASELATITSGDEDQTV